MNKIFCGDAPEVLRQLPSESVQMCVTSPPYYGLRDYGVDGQLGCEPSPLAYAERLVEVFREVRHGLQAAGVAVYRHRVESRILCAGKETNKRSKGGSTRWR